LNVNGTVDAAEPEDPELESGNKEEAGKVSFSKI
jgi:hypothetical protein